MLVLLLLLERGLVSSDDVVVVLLWMLVEEGGSRCPCCCCSCCCCSCSCSCLVEAGVELDGSWAGAAAAGVDLKRSHIVAIEMKGSPSLARESS